MMWPKSVYGHLNIMIPPKSEVIMELFVHIEELELKNRQEFESLFQCCSKELRTPLDDIIPYFIYQVGSNAGVLAYDVYGAPIGYLLYHKQDNYYINLTHFWVAPKVRRNKIATRMISNIIIKEQPYIMSAYVNDVFLSAQLLLKFLGFKCIRIIKRSDDFDKYYFVTKDDGKISRFNHNDD